MIYAFVITFSILGGILYRFRGGWPSIPRPIEQALFCSIFLVLMILLGLPWQHSVIAYALAVAATLKGHGNNMDLGHYDKPAEPEWYEFLIKGYKGKFSAYWYDFIGITLSGLTITGVPGLMISFFDPILGVVIGISGALKGPAYMLGWLMHPKYDNGPIKLKIGKFTLASATEWGEFFTGLFIWSVSARFLFDFVEF